MIYKGSNKHNIEELESIIETLLEEKYNKVIDEKYDSFLLSETSELLKDIYRSCIVEEGKEIEGKKIIENIKSCLEEFSKNNNFEL